MIINLVAEGYTEEIVASRLIPFCGHELGFIYGKRGHDYIRQSATNFKHLATEHSGVLVLSDFRDTGAKCVPEAIEKYLFSKQSCFPRTFVFRFSVGEIESWLLADNIGLAGFLGVAKSRIPIQPENEEFPKRALVNLARFSRDRKIREGMAPPPGHQAVEGPEYVGIISKYITEVWNIEAAMCRAQSLERCIRRLQSI